VECEDVTVRKASEEHQALLIAELAHRVKNSLTVLHSLASRLFGAAWRSLWPAAAAFARYFSST